MLKTNLMVMAIVVLLAGIGLWVYGYNLEPTTGDAIDNVFTGDFTDKRNVLMFSGVAIAVVGGAGVAGAAISGRGRQRYA